MLLTLKGFQLVQLLTNLITHTHFLSALCNVFVIEFSGSVIHFFPTFAQKGLLMLLVGQ